MLFFGKVAPKCCGCCVGNLLGNFSSKCRDVVDAKIRCDRSPTSVGQFSQEKTEYPDAVEIDGKLRECSSAALRRRSFDRRD